MNIVIAVDGPSGSGKSTVSRMVARQLAISYVDTGAMYRAAAWWAQHQGIDLHNSDAVTQAVRDMPLVMPVDPNNQTIVVADHDVTSALRTSEISTVVSLVATNLDVREELVRRQQQIIADQRAAGQGVIAEGRDITTVVAPDADVRVLLTASEAERIRRRTLEIRGRDDEQAMAETAAEVVGRDEKDSTVLDFMNAGEGVHLIDSSAMTILEVVSAIVELARKASHE
ncbi:MAG: (d)CMP kinase [Actinomycetaceae bacterium]|nr:(d)CMP kinase [Actinomycetaceae bacterium]MDY6083187.1 (d)CMP kinase [Actinomycetaceae bacterium]